MQALPESIPRRLDENTDADCIFACLIRRDGHSGGSRSKEQPKRVRAQRYGPADRPHAKDLEQDLPPHLTVSKRKQA